MFDGEMTNTISIYFDFNQIWPINATSKVMGNVYAEKLKVCDCDSFLNQTLFWKFIKKTIL